MLYAIKKEPCGWSSENWLEWMLEDADIIITGNDYLREYNTDNEQWDKLFGWDECVPIIIEVYGKYVGKQYGPKTKKKIGQEIFEKTGERFKCCVTVGSQYTYGSITIYAVDYPYGVTIDIPAYPTLFAGNTIEELTEDNLKFRGVRWELIEQHRKVQAAMDVLCSEASKYKAMSVGGMQKLPDYQQLNDYDM